MIRMKGWVILGLLICLTGCFGKKIPLNKDQFTALLIDMHRADGTLSVVRGGLSENKNYEYYNAVFDKYGIDRAEFDSCMYYYSAQKTLFAKMYDVVIDSLNKQLTQVNVVLGQLRLQDSVNLFPLSDTIVFDTAMHVMVGEIDSIVCGQYKFTTNIRFDKPDEGKNNRITAFFLAEKNRQDTVSRKDTLVSYDTLHVRNVVVMSDTISHIYSWSQYVDSTYSRLIIKFVDADNLKKLKKREGKAWGTNLFKPYIGGETERRLKDGLIYQKRAKSLR